MVFLSVARRTLITGPIVPLRAVRVAFFTCTDCKKRRRNEEIINLIGREEQHRRGSAANRVWKIGARYSELRFLCSFIFSFLVNRGERIEER